MSDKANQGEDLSVVVPIEAHAERGFDARGRAAAPDDTPTIAHVLRALVDEWRTVAVAVILGLIAAVTYSVAATPQYESNVLIQVTKAKPLAGLDELAPMFGDASPADTEVEILRSRKILGPVIERLQLDMAVAPRRAPVVGDAFARRYGGDGPAPARFGLRQYAWGGERIAIGRLEVSNDLLNDRMVLTALEGGGYRLAASDGTLLLEGRVGTQARSEGPRKAEIVVSELVARTGSSFVLARRSTESVVSWLRDAIQISEKGRKSGVLVVSLQGPDPAGVAAVVEAITATYLRHTVERLSSEAQATLDFVELQLPVQMKRLDKAEAAYKEFQVREGTVSLKDETRNLLARVGEVEKSLSEVQLEQADLNARANVRHPQMLALELRAASLRAQRLDLDRQLRLLPQKEVATARLSREVAVASEIYTFLLKKAQELRVLKSGVVGNVVVLDPPLVAREPVSPRTPAVVLAGLLAGLTLGLALALVRRVLDDGADDPETIEAATGLPIYVAIPHSEREARAARKGAGGALRVLAADAPDDPAVEGLRTVRTVLESAMAGARNDVVAIGAPTREMGKSFVAVNLAHLAAASGRKVLLVDADLRSGCLHRSFGLDQAPGLSDALRGDRMLEEVLRATGVAQLDLLSKGTAVPNPAELLAGKPFERLLSTAASRYDLVVLDTAPVLGVADPLLVARCAGVNVLVVRAGRHGRSALRVVVKRFAQAGVRLNGIVLNDVRRTRRRSGAGTGLAGDQGAAALV